MRVEAAFPAFLVGHRIVAHDAVPRADRAECAEAPPAAKGFAVDAQALFAVGIDEAPRSPLAEGWRNIVLPQIERFEHVTVCVNDVICQTHLASPLGCASLLNLFQEAARA